MIELNYKSFGEGQPVIILHGLFGMLDNWKSFAVRLSKEYEVFIVDQRNHGRSPHTERISYDLMSQDLYNFIQQQGLNDLLLIGHSMGGKVVAQFCLDHPALVEKAVVVDMGLKEYPGNHYPIFESLLNLKLDKISDRKTAESILAEQIDDPSTLQFLLKNLKRTGQNNFQWKMNLKGIYAQYPELITSIDSSFTSDSNILFVKAGESDYVLEEDWLGIQEIFVNARYEVVEDAGHWIHADNPEYLYELINSFFAEKESLFSPL